MSLPRLALRLRTEADAYMLLEKMRWGKQPVCPHCQSIDKHYFIQPNRPRTTSSGAVTHRRLWKCSACRKPFSVLTGTVMHGTHISIRTWLMVMFDVASAKNGISSREIQRKYGVTPKTAWFLTHRIREAMQTGPLAEMMRGTIVADETWIGGTPSNRHGAKSRAGLGHYGIGTDKISVLSVVNKENHEVRSHIVEDTTGPTLRKVIAEHVDISGSTLHTDKGSHYIAMGKEFIAHETVDHGAGEYVRGEVTTNQAEGYFSQLKRSLDGTHHHVSEKHMARYTGEFDFRYNTHKMSDSERMERIVKRSAGRRLTYKELKDSGAA